MGGILDAIANYNPTGFALGNQQKAATLAQTGAQTAQTQAVTQEQQLIIQQEKQKLADQQALAQIFQNAGREASQAVSSTPPATPGPATAGGAPPAPGQAIATPGVVAGAGGPPPSMVAGAPHPLLDPNNLLRQYYANGGKGTEPIYGAINQILKTGKEATDLSKDQRAQEEAQRELAASQVQNLLTLPAEQRAGVYQQILPRLRSEAPDVNWNFDPSDDNALHGVLGATLAHKAMLDQANTEAETASRKSTAKKSDVETQLLEHQNDLYKTLTASPEALSQRVAGSIDPQKYPQEYAAALNEAKGAADLKGIQEAISRHSQNISEREKQIAVETDPAVNKARTAQQVATATATAPIHAAEAEGVAATNARMQAGERALTTTLASENSVNATKQTGETLKALLARAAQGDATAAQQFKSSFPLFGVSVQGSHRLPGSEIDKTPGSAFDKFQGLVGGIVEGQPIPPRVLKEAPGVIDELVAGGVRAHNSMVDTYKKNYDIKADHVAVPGTIVQKSPSTGAFRYSTDGGRTWQAGQPPNQ